VRTPGVWSVAVGTSAAVGSGVVCAVVALSLHWIRPEVPFPTAPRLVEIVSDEDFSLKDATPLVDAMRARPDLFDRVVVYKDNMWLFLDGDRVGNGGTIAGHDLLETLGVQPLMGRLFTAEEDLPGLGQSVILSEDFWRSRFGGDPRILGTEIDFQGRLGSVTVVGIVSASGLQLPVLGAGADFVLPVGNPGGEAWMADVSLLARVAPGRSREDAVDWWQTISPELPAATAAGASSSIDPSPDFELRPFRGVQTNAETFRILLGLAAAAALALAVAVLNVAVLAWLDALRRAQALSVRVALGAARWRVGVLLLRRCLVPVAIGGAVGVAGAWLVLDRLRDAASRNVFFVIPEVSWPAAGLALGVCALAAAGGALWPLRAVLGLDVTRSLKREPGGWSGVGGGRLRTIVGTQVAVASALLMVGALFEAAVDGYVAEDRGFEVGEVSFASVRPGTAYEGTEGVAAMSRLLGDPQLLSAGVAVGDPPLPGRVMGLPQLVRGPGDGEPSPVRTWVAPVSAAYTECLGIDLAEGRFFTEEEAARGAAVAVLDEATARALDATSSVVGRTIGVYTDTAWATVQVIGTVEPVRLTDARTGQQLQQVYVPFALLPMRDYPILIDTRLASSLPAIVERVLPGASVEPPTRFRDLYRAEARTQLVASRAVGTVAGLGLVLALVGLFAVLGHAAERRRQEFGVRQAVGASPSAIVLLSLRSGLGLSAVGLCVGVVGAALAGSVLRSTLLGVAAWDAGAMGLTAIVVMSSSLVACLRPAVSAGRTDPSALMRAE